MASELETELESEGRRIETGSFYTPDYIVEYIVEETVGPLVEREDDLDDLFVLDPACGNGAFLLGALDYISKRRQERDPDLSDSEAQRKTAMNNLYGVDILPEAVDETKIRIRDAIGDDPDGLGLDDKIKVGNSLVGLSVDELPVDVGEVVG